VILALDCSQREALFCLELAPGDLELQHHPDPPDHADWLSATLQGILVARGRRASELGRVALTLGPGSFTGLRVGLAFAKGLVFGSDIPLLPLPSLALPALASAEARSRGVLVCRRARGREYWAGSFSPGAETPSWEGLLPESQLGEALARLRRASPRAELMATLPAEHPLAPAALPEPAASARLQVLARLAREGEDLRRGGARSELLPRYLLEPAVTLPGRPTASDPRP
jgi:tRNA threonylcarbamoyl adenosine modification protein YeaZ